MHPKPKIIQDYSGLQGLLCEWLLQELNVWVYYTTYINIIRSIISCIMPPKSTLQCFTVHITHQGADYW